MKIDRGPSNWVWIALGTAGLLVAIAVTVHQQIQQDRAGQRVRKIQRIDLVQRLRADLSEASEAEKSAVMADTDEASRAFADQTRAATAAVERDREQLGQLLRSGGSRQEQARFDEFSRAFVEYQSVDTELLELAVKNTNIKAYALAFGPAAESIREMDGALSRLIEKSEKSAAAGAKRVIFLAGEADRGALRIQALLPTHVSEVSDPKMDAMEASMAEEDAQVRRSLDELAAQAPSVDRAEVRSAAEAYAAFSELRKRILELSRQNTNVKSLALSLNRKRLIDLKCQDALAALEEAIQGERVPEAPEIPR